MESLRSPFSAQPGDAFEGDILGELLRPDILRDPYPFYSLLRTHAFGRQLGSLAGVIFTRHADVAELLVHADFSNHFPVKYDRAGLFDGQKEMIHSDMLRRLARAWMQSTDRDLHSRVRRKLIPFFSPSRLEGLADGMRRTCWRLLSTRSAQAMDFMSQLAQPMIDDVLEKVFGVTAEICAQIRLCSAEIAAFLGATEVDGQILDGVDREVRALTAALTPIIEQRRQRPADDLISALSSLDWADTDVEEVAMQATFTLAAGLDTTAGLLGNGLVAFIRHPASIGKLRKDPTLFPRAVEECLRFDSPSQWLPRVARKDTKVRGILIREGELIWLGLGSANRDPTRFPAADEFDIERPPIPMVSFGGGIHHCLGAWLARLEAQIVFHTMFDALTRLELDAEDICYRSNFAIRSPQSLPIRYCQRACY